MLLLCHVGFWWHGYLSFALQCNAHDESARTLFNNVLSIVAAWKKCVVASLIFRATCHCRKMWEKWETHTGEEVDHLRVVLRSFPAACCTRDKRGGLRTWLQIDSARLAEEEDEKRRISVLATRTDVVTRSWKYQAQTMPSDQITQREEVYVFICKLLKIYQCSKLQRRACSFILRTETFI